MNHYPLISIIVPAYNVEKTLCRCIDSILNQNLQDFEILLVDDGSTDNTPEICDEYKDRDARVRVFHKPNGGVSSARNYGLGNANGKWIAFCDSDDFVYKDWLDNFNAKDNMRYDIVCQGIKIEYITGEIIQVSHDEKLERTSDIVKLIDELNKQGVFGYPVTKLFKRELIEFSDCPLRFNIEYDFMEDEDFICRYLQRCNSIIYTKGAGYHYFLPDLNKHEAYSMRRLPLYFNLLKEVQVVSKGVVTGVERKYHDSISVILVAECQKNAFRREYMLRLRDYVVKEFRHCPIILPTKIILALDPTGFFSALWLKLHLKIKKVDYTRF